MRGDIAFFRGDEQLTVARRGEAGKVEVRFRASKGDQERRGAILVRVRGGEGVQRDEGAVGLLAELLDRYEGQGLTDKAPLMTFREGGKWKVWGRDRATKCLREGLEGVGKRWGEEGRGAGAGLVPEHFALHSGRIGGATRLAAMGVAEAVIQKEGRWASDAYKVYGRANMEHPVLVSGVLEAGAGRYDRQPGQGTKFGE